MSVIFIIGRANCVFTKKAIEAILGVPLPFTMLTFDPSKESKDAFWDRFPVQLDTADKTFPKGLVFTKLPTGSYDTRPLMDSVEIVAFAHSPGIAPGNFVSFGNDLPVISITEFMDQDDLKEEVIGAVNSNGSFVFRTDLGPVTSGEIEDVEDLQFEK